MQRKKQKNRNVDQVKREKNEGLVEVDEKTQRTDHSTYTIDKNPHPLPTNIDPWGNPNT